MNATVLDPDSDLEPDDEDPEGSEGNEAGGSVVRFVVDFKDRGVRLDAWLATHLTETSRSRAAALVDEGCVTVDARVLKAAHKLRGGEKVFVTLKPPAPTTLQPQDIPLTLVFDDADFCVIDKPAGLVVHPGAGHDDGTVANALLFRFPGLSIGGERRPGIVHRLDKDTSGLLVVAKNDETQRALSRLFHDRKVDKRYVALVLGTPKSPLELITGHRRANNDRRRFTTRLDVPATDGAGGSRRAHSRFTVRASRDGVSVVDVELLTGRTHQIRAHLADVGHPLLQDELYGGGHAEKRLKAGPVRDAVVQLHRQALHAASLSLPHPRTGTLLRFASPLPADLQAIVDVVAG